MPGNYNRLKIDEALLLRIQKGDENAFELIFRKYYPHLVLFARQYVHDNDLAESLVQDVFIKMWEKKRGLVIKSLRGYLVVAVRNHCYNEMKRQNIVRGYEKQEVAKEQVELPVFNDSVYMDKINQVIDQLPEQRKRIFKMSRMDGLKYKEIALKLGISIKTVEVQMGKALKYLREHLQPLKKHVLSIFL